MIIARLAVLAGPDLGAEFQIGADGGAIGRGAGCAVKLTDPAASRTHAVLAVREGVLHLRDEGGPNPTLVNGSPHGDGALRDGDRVRVGQTTLIVLPPEGGLVPLAEPGRTLNTLELGSDGRGSIEAALIELAAQWRRAAGPTEVARAACRVARELFAGRRAVVLSPDAAGRLVAA
ncbi:MAG: FHA domain-containing protein, partial [Deltaproteobacteria bacterium]|nr:FHA domain-containing protein [Kofleriaceae bacterium]